jgi:MFS family permease
MTQPAVTQSPHKPLEKKTPAYAWYVVAVLTAIYMLSFVDRSILSLLVPQIEHDLKVDDTQIGLLGGFAFALFYTFMGLPLGRMVDSLNRRGLVAVCIVVWSCFTSVCSAATTFGALFLSRIGVGVGEAGLGPAAYSLIADYVPRERMGAAISVYYMGLFFGTALAQTVGGITVQTLSNTPVLHVPILGAIASWRVTFLIVGLPGLLFALLGLTIREPARGQLQLDASGRITRATFGEAFAQMRLRWQSVVGISLGMAFQATCNYAVMQWTPVYFLRVHGWKPAQTGKTLALILIVFACSGMYWGGWLSDRWQKRGVLDARLRVALVSAAGILLFLVPSTMMTSVQWTLALFAPGIFFLALAMGTAVAALQVIFPNQSRGQVGALFLFVLNLVGLTIGPWLPGFLDDHVFHDQKMIGFSLAITVALGAGAMAILLGSTRAAYRRHYGMLLSEAPAAQR